ncbi:MAG: Ppx/GppA phosphatase family protein [Amphiplicatus sp.]
MAEGKRRRRRRPSDGGKAPVEPTGNGASATLPVMDAKPDAGDRPKPKPPKSARRHAERFAALDLGTNNCRLLIAAPRGRQLRIVDAFSRIVRLGEGLSQTGALLPAAMDRAVEALKVCAEKIEKRGVSRQRCIATQACRAAANGAEFLARVEAETGLVFEIISTSEEARLSVKGCAELLDPKAEAGLVFDIGGGSTEISWIRHGANGAGADIAAWASMPLGVVSLSERWGGREIDLATYERIVESVRAEVAALGDPASLREIFARDGAHYLGTSGTVTSIAGVHLALPRYRRDVVDGLWLTIEEARGVTEKLRSMSFDDRAAEPCIGRERADLVVCGCAILEALQREWPASRIRVGDRGLREGMLADLADQARRRRRRKTSKRVEKTSTPPA